MRGPKLWKESFEIEKRDFDEGIKFYDKILEDNPGNIESWVYKGDTFFQQNNYGEAVKCYTMALTIEPNCSDVQEKYKKSIQTYTFNPSMSLIPEGKFQMGSNNGYANEEPVHTVKLHSFYMSTYEVTNGEYCIFLNSQGNQSSGKSTWLNIVNSNYCGLISVAGPEKFQVKPGYEARPVVYVNWYGAVAYCDWLNELHGLKGETEGYRLPTEAEWEYACRAGTYTNYYWGNTMDENYCYCNDCAQNHQNVDSKLPNKFGLYGLSGNIWEWCSDWYGEYSSSSQTNPEGPSAGTTKVRRGGSWCSTADLCRSAFRSSASPGVHGFGMGFRIVKT
jgi:formylglycine-generating enzyme